MIRIGWLLFPLAILINCGGGDSSNSSAKEIQTEESMDSTRVQLSNNKIKKTGQIISYESFDDGEYQMGVEPSYSGKSGEIVIDDITGLHWQDNEDAKLVLRDWNGAKNYCKELSFKGYHDWRLPTRKELNSIVDYSKSNPAISTYFQNIVSDYYWASTAYLFAGNAGWGVEFSGGNDSWAFDSNAYYVRCVRK